MSDYHALSYKDKIVTLERFEVSSQGVSKLISYHRWNLNQKSGYPIWFFCDNKLNEIWAANVRKVWCLRTNGQNQEVNDHLHNLKGGSTTQTITALIVGKGEISLFRKGGNCHIRFDENGYNRLDPFDFQELNNYIEEGDFKVVLDQYHHPELPEQYIIVDQKHRKSKVYYVDYEGQVTLENDDDITNKQELVEMLKEQFPEVCLGGYETMTVNWDKSPKYLFSSDAIKLGSIGQPIAVSEIGEGNLRPRYPMTHAQKTFEEDIRARLDLHESILKEEFPRYFGHN